MYIILLLGEGGYTYVLTGRGNLKIRLEVAVFRVLFYVVELFLLELFGEVGYLYYLCGVISNLHLCFSTNEFLGRPLCG